MSAPEAVPGAFVAGHPIGHSRSPMIHRHWLQRYGVEGRYEPVDVAPENFAAFVQELRSGRSGFVGGNVTIPLKEMAFELADTAEPEAARLKAANTLWLRDGRLHATNTDGYGFGASLDSAAPGWDRCGGGPRRALVLGAGGASRAVIDQLLRREFESIVVLNRTAERAHDLARHFAGPVEAGALSRLDECLETARFFVNCSAAGMSGASAPRIDFSRMPKGSVVTDIVYSPLETPVLKMARDAGLATVDGLGMLLHQAVPGFHKWFGIRPEVTPELRALVEADLEQNG